VESLQEALNAATGREKYVCTKHEALLSKFSFEFRTALTGIIGMVQFLMDTPLNDDQAEYTETLDQCSVQLLDLVDGLLASKNDSKKIEEYPELAREVSAAVIQGSSGPDAASAGLSGIRILLAEDNELNAKVAKKMLLEAGALVDVAANGQIAVEHMLKSHYDLVLMDCEMPVMSGWDAVRHIRKAGCVSTPVIALTAHTVGEAWAQCADAGMTGILSKPFHEKQLYQAIREAVAKNNGVGT
jgi:CheY-like chemotaxis protein